jgi:outer membrane lipoprotein-sorting protein
MPRKKWLLLIAATALLGLPGRSLWADDLQQVLKELDASAAKFHATSADFEFDTNQTEPVPDQDVMKGTAYYERNGASFSMAAHVKQENGADAPKTYMFTDGSLKLFQPSINQVTTIKRASAFESYLMLGFGASGKDLADKWEIKDDGAETLDGVKTEKLELVAKDPTVRKNLPKVTVWMDTTRAISLKQVFDVGQGVTRTSLYFNIKLNQPLPADAFKFKTDRKTTYQEQ